MNQNADIEILLVEDNPRDAEMTIRTLRRHNIANQIIHVRDGQEALDCVFGNGAYAGRDPSNHPKLLLLDLKLPKVDGLEVLRAIRADERTRLMTVVMMTSSREQQDVIESYQLGVNSYVVKPVEFDSFSAAVAELGHYWLLVNQGTK
jgi:two-component system response regulator